MASTSAMMGHCLWLESLKLNNQFGMAPYSEYKRMNENGDYDYNNDNQSFRQLRPQQRRKPWRPGNFPDYNRQRPGHGPGQFDLKSALADIVSRMRNVELTHFE